MPLGPCRMSLILTIFVLVVFAQPMALLHGYIYGLTFLIILGPVFFTLLNSTLQYGFRSGFSVALGIFSSDLVCVGLLFGLGITDFFLHPSHQFWIGLVGALVLLGLGGAYAVKKPRLAASSSTMTTSGAGYSSFFLKGFVINFFNPFVFAVWMGFIALAAKFYPDPRMQSLFPGRYAFGHSFNRYPQGRIGQLYQAPPQTPMAEVDLPHHGCYPCGLWYLSANSHFLSRLINGSLFSIAYIRPSIFGLDCESFPLNHSLVV
jgi:threonine/homoserine/homoserine lactone efflux protein